MTLVFTAQWFSLGGMRCSPLNAALTPHTMCENIITFAKRGYFVPNNLR
ncbi:hypothetical protein DC357_21420 [Vibrio vulnificus]|nr:hypothetical protein DC357_21420 [Vibrio vulnificus]